MELDLDTLPPLPQIPSPGIPKHSRLKPHSSHSALVTSAVVATPSPNQVISTLINSLTALSESAREQLRKELDADNHIPSSAAVETNSIYRPETPEPEELSHFSNTDDELRASEELNDADVAAPPVIRFSRSPPRLKKKSKKKLTIHTNTSWSQSMLSPRLLTPRRSMQSLAQRDDSAPLGVPSIERPNGSTTSLPFFAIPPRSPSRGRPSTSARSQTSSRSVHDSRLSPDTLASDSAQPVHGQEQEHDLRRKNITPTPSSAPDETSPVDTVTTPSSTDSRSSSAVGSLSPANRGELRDRLIPYRYSSLRRSARNMVEGPDGQLKSAGSKNLKELQIDDELIEADDSTVRRIRELQAAREKRHKEWRKEARKSEKATKRLAQQASKSAQQNGTSQTSKSSAPEVTEVSEVDSPVQMASQATDTELADTPKPLPSPSAINSSVNQPPSPARPDPVTTTTSPIEPKPVGTPKHKRRISSQIRRSSTFTSPTPELPIAEAKSIAEEVDAFLTAPRLTQRIRHPRTGRTIAFSEVGDPEGFVVLCCVGMGLTRYVTTFYDELARTLKLRIITPERPGVGESQGLPEGPTTPLGWVDDVAVICSALEITRFSLLAHSAGAIYAFATALKMPQYVRGRIHLLAPWIPPSQMPKGAAIGPDSQPLVNLPFSHKILSVLPAPILKVANSRFLSATSASVEPRGFLTSKKTKHLEGLDAAFASSLQDLGSVSRQSIDRRPQEDIALKRSRSQSCYQANNENLVSQGILSRNSVSDRALSPTSSGSQTTSPRPMSPQLTTEARQTLYNSALTHRIWHLSTLNANPALDLLVCLERRKTIGFRYPEVTRSVVIHHGTQDTRVPLDNVKWLQSVMKRCELRVLDEEGHGLMASASVMSSVIAEIAKEWEEWEKISKEKEKKMREEVEKAAAAAKSRRNYR